MNRQVWFLFKCCVLTLINLSSAVLAGETRFELGLRANVELADGTPANDILGYGIYGRIPLSPEWGIGIGLDLSGYDLENPARSVGIPTVGTKIIDASATSTMVSVWGERYFNEAWGKSTPYLKLGIGINSIDVDNATGPTPGGSTYNIQTDVSTDTVLFAGGGLKVPMGKNWFFDGTLGINQHFGKWTIQDLNSSATGTIDGFSSWIMQLGVTRKF